MSTSSGYANGPVEMTPPRRFTLTRHADVSGVSGTGLVASGVMWGDGSVALHWHTKIRSHVIFPALQDMLELHGHAGATELVWLDEAAG
jgi:hypothetical protein